jgi:hypothetical protein
MLNKKVFCICKNCGKGFFKFQSKINDGRGKYCSKSCMIEHRKGIPNLKIKGENNGMWKENPNDNTFRIRANKLKQKIECELCGRKQNLRIHHKDKNCRNNTPNNLIVICESCHRQLHNQTTYPQIQKQCLQCQKIFFVRLRKKNQKYCSAKCGFEAQKNGIYKNCLFCGKEIYVIKYFQSTKKYCSQNCYREYKKLKNKGVIKNGR